MTKRAAGEALALRLYAAETAVDAALAATAGLAAELPAARSGAMVSATVGQQAFDGAAGAMTALVQARGELVRTHRTLAALARRLGLDDLAVGPVDKPEDDIPIGRADPARGKKMAFPAESC